MRVVAVEARSLTLLAMLDRFVLDGATREVAVIGCVVGNYKILLLLEDSPRSDPDQWYVAAEAAPSFTCS